MHRQRVAGEQHVDVAAADQIAEVGAAAGVDDDRTGDEGDLPPAALTSRIIAAMRDDADLDAPLRRDLVGHEREAVAVALLELRHDLDAVDAADDGVAAADVAQLAADGARAPSIDDRGVHALVARPSIHWPPMRDVGLMVGRRVEVLRRAAVAIGGREMRVLGARDAAAERDQLLERPRSAPPAPWRVTRIETNDGSSLVRPMRNSSTSNAASWRTTVSNIAFMSCESIRWPSASTTSVTAVSRGVSRVIARIAMPSECVIAAGGRSKRR